MNFNQTHFTTSAVKLAGCPADSEAEIAFAGRSNAGKSSAINAITGQTRLARISKTPGRTQLINFFEVNAGRYLVDLPGYGFAKVPLAVKNQWQRELEKYLREREVLSGIVVLSDIRHPMKEFDQQMVEWSVQSDLPVLLLLTKADKLKRGAAQNTLLKVRKALQDKSQVRVELFSAQNGTGVDSAREQLSEWLTV
ncbi:MAG: YihA family ribosome biogenesis GTP-binding protein [Gammaproteobacteria bacterium]|nr:YihA family ribosome biogenesis GTP-binding protein [Gammaproteobacteria bacterium]